MVLKIISLAAALYVVVGIGVFTHSIFMALLMLWLILD
jgi:hypothetical protein